MIKSPSILTGFVVRKAIPGESHGGLYLINLENKTSKQVLDWDDPSIDWHGRGGQRGLRGIAFYNEQIYIATGTKILILNQDFEIIRSIRNRYLNDCHEICIHNDKLYLTSTNYESLLEYDLVKNRFNAAWHAEYASSSQVSINPFDPNSNEGPDVNTSIHLNNVGFYQGKMYFSGTVSNSLIMFDGQNVETYSYLPYTSHNAQPYRENVLLNDTANSQLAYMQRDGQILETFKMPVYPEQKLIGTEHSKEMVRQGFARGLVITDEGLLIAGSSPATITVFQHGQVEPITSIQLSNDIRCAIHGLEIWPY